MPTPEAPENKKGDTPTDYVFRVAEGRQPRSIERALLVLRGGGTWVGLQGRDEVVPTAGGKEWLYLWVFCRCAIS